MDWNRFKVEMFPYLIMAVILMMGVCWIVKDDLIFYRTETYESWEKQQDYSEMLRREINSYKDKVADLNTNLQVCKTELIYTKRIKELGAKE